MLPNSTDRVLFAASAAVERPRSVLFSIVGFFRQTLAFFKARWYSLALAVVTIAVSGAIGLRLTPWLAHSLGVVPLRYSVLQTPTSDFNDGIIKMLASAQEEIFIAAPRIDDGDVLLALQTAERKGVKVVVILSEDEVSPTVGSLGWLMHYHVGQVYTDKFPFRGLTLVIDRQIALISALQVAVKAKVSGTTGTVLFLRHPDVVRDLRNGLISRAERGQRQLPQ